MQAISLVARAAVTVAAGESPRAQSADEVLGRWEDLKRDERAKGGAGPKATLEGVPRTLPGGLGVEVDTGSWPVPPIFSVIQQRGDIGDEEMVRTFNVGIGMTAVVPAGGADAALSAIGDACRIGRVVEVGPGEPRVRFA